MALTIAQKSDLRRHLGYPVVGLPSLNPAGGSLYDGSVGYRWNTAYSFLEWKMDTLNPDEEARITGYAYGSVLVTGSTQPGDTVTVTLSGGPLSSPVALTVTAGSQDTALTLAVALTALANQNATLAAAQFYAVAPYGSGPFSMRPGAIPLSEFAILNPQSYTLTAAATGATGAAVTTNGAMLPPRAVLTDPLSEQPSALYGYLPILDALETGAVGTSEDLDTLRADVWHARQDELEEREKLYKFWRLRLSKFLYIPLWENTPLDTMLGSNDGPGSFV